MLLQKLNAMLLFVFQSDYTEIWFSSIKFHLATFILSDLINIFLNSHNAII